jgi:hypothetical protein
MTSYLAKEGGGWRVARHAKPDEWHLAKDNLVGTEVYGIKDCYEEQYSVKFDDDNFDQFLFLN